MSLRRLAALLFLGCPLPTQADTPRIELPVPDIAAALAADASRSALQPWRFAVAIPTRIAPPDGQWEIAGDEARWTLELHAPGARHLNLGFGRIALPPGAQLRVASVLDQRGPYRAGDETAAQLWTPIVRGDQVQLELTLPVAQRAQLVLELTQVGYGFRGFGTDPPGAKASVCHVDIACPEGEEWRDEARATARITAGGVFGCSATLMNNTAQDFRPLLLTAGHCFPIPALAPTTVVYWNYEKTRCGGERDGSLGQSQTGATMLALNNNGLPVLLTSDFALLELTQRPAESFGVYYSGWDNRDLAPVGVVGIHHPLGEEKKISLDADPVLIYPPEPTPDPNLYVEGWDQGTIESGSSGSGLWNLEHRLIAQLSTAAADATCGAEGAGYGRLNQSWHQANTPLTSVASHLDPLDSGAETLDGIDPAGPAVQPDKAAAEQAAMGSMPTALMALLLVAIALRAGRP